MNIVGGVQVDEPAADLGIAMTIASSFKEKAISPDTVFVGEVGLEWGGSQCKYQIEI